MKLKELLDYVDENARDVSDLAKVANIKSSESNDPYRNFLIKELCTKYKDEIEEAERNLVLQDLLRDW